MSDLISRQAAIDAILHNQEVYSNNFGNDPIDKYTIAIIDNDAQTIAQLPSAQPEDYTVLKREFLRMASYIDVLLECSDEQKETLIGFISRLAEFMPWTEEGEQEC
jgi:hypothetical protein